MDNIQKKIIKELEKLETREAPERLQDHILAVSDIIDDSLQKLSRFNAYKKAGIEIDLEELKDLQSWNIMAGAVFLRLLNDIDKRLVEEIQQIEKGVNNEKIQDS